MNKIAECVALHEFTEKAYLNYSMYVLMDRALPFIGDGLKPVQRRIVYAMFELGLHSTSKFKKSARTVGDVLGKYHPHSDIACYEAMVLMEQSFSYRYPLIEGQGNWGASDDPKSFAAMRYTESRLSKYADTLISELNHDTVVDWLPNFDGTLQEPRTLPARLPNILLNGAIGIAVGMATDIPTHNLHEVTKAAISILENPKTTLDKILSIIQGPDFPTEAEIITSRSEIRKIYQKGRGSLRTRAIWKKEDNAIVITALPYQVSGSRILEQIEFQMRNKKLPMIYDLRDESDSENMTRLVLIPRSNSIDVEQVMNYLFVTTDLEKSYRINMNMIGLDGRPAIKNLLEILVEWLTFRKNTVRRRLNYRLEKIIKRLDILEGFLIAYLNANNVIHIIRSEDKPKDVLMSRFKISKTRAESILELKIRHLAKLEEIKIRNEQKKLQKECNQIQNILASERKINNLIKKELKKDATVYGDCRRSPIHERKKDKILINKQNILPSELVTIILSQMGWIRIAKGHDIDVKKLKYKVGDSFKLAVKGKRNQLVALIDSRGRSYTINPITLPSARSHGEHITGKIFLPTDSKIDYMVTENNSQKLLVASDDGYGFICTFHDLISRNRTGKLLIPLLKNAQVLPPLIIKNDYDMLLTITKSGRALIFSLKDFPSFSRGKRRKIIDIPTVDVETRKNFITYLSIIQKQTELNIQINKQIVKFSYKDLQKTVGKMGCCGKFLKILKHIERVEDSSLKEALK